MVHFAAGNIRLCGRGDVNERVQGVVMCYAIETGGCRVVAAISAR